MTGTTETCGTHYGAEEETACYYCGAPIYQGDKYFATSEPDNGAFCNKACAKSHFVFSDRAQNE